MYVAWRARGAVNIWGTAEDGIVWIGVRCLVYLPSYEASCTHHNTHSASPLSDPACVQVGISDFRDRRDLIDAWMASSHVPLALDMRATRECRGRACIDGSFPDFFYGNCDLLTRGGSAVVFDYFEDKELKRQGRMDMLQLTS